MTNQFYFKQWKSYSAALFATLLATFSNKSMAQTCPANASSTITTNPNTYYPGLNATLSSGANSITLGAASGTTPIAAGDLLLLIQMQGAQINSTNTTSYGSGVSGTYTNGYLTNAAMTAGNMEYVAAKYAVPLAGGTLTLSAGTVNSYKNANFGTDGQYRYQIIRVGLYFNLTLGATITAPSWNGTTGGVIAISVTGTMDFNGHTITAAGAGFRGGAGRQLSGGTGGLKTDFVTMSTSNFNGSKGEGIAGTPRYVNDNGTMLDNGASNEGYPGGSYASGAPGNAGGGGTDANPSSNDQNSGGGGGANGGAGGKGGNSWSSNIATGGEPGAAFTQRSPSRLVMGGGGGAGTTNNGTGTPGAGFASSGAAGGGIVLLTAASITGTGTIDASGASSYTTTTNDGSGGGGAGGSVLIYAGSGVSNITVLAKGGMGGSNTGGGSSHGPGGGGGGGVIYSNAPVNASSSSAAAGAQGTTAASATYGAAVGGSGVLVQNVTIQQVPAQNLDCSVLPVRFKSIDAKRNDNNVVISWKVTNEAGVKNYTIEKSDDGKDFSTTGLVAFRYTSSADNSYSFTDTKNNNTTAYYRIREVSESGSDVYSSIVTAKANGTETAGISVSPNPAVSGTAYIRFTLKSAPTDAIRLRMFSMNGSTVWQKQYRAAAGHNEVQIENLALVPNGVYFIQYYNSQESMNVKMIVSH